MTERAIKYQVKTQAGSNGRAKIPLRRIASDSCAVWQGRVIQDGAIVSPGIPYYVHKGEWVEILPIVSVGEMLALMRLREQGISVEALGEMENAFESICRELAARVVRWNWTDIQNEPMEQPWKRPDILKRLTTDELFWLLTNSLSVETEGEQKNA